MSTPNIDASLFNPEMGVLGNAALGMSCYGASAVCRNYDDANADGKLDCVFFFQVKDHNLATVRTADMLLARGSYALYTSP